MVLIKMEELFVHFARQLELRQKKSALVIPAEKSFDQIMEYIRLHYRDADLKDTARVFGYSENHLSRLIHQKTGQTFSNLIREYRLLNAESYLVHSDLSVEQITDLTGYSDTGYLNKLFLKRFGSSPVRYRKEHRGR